MHLNDSVSGVSCMADFSIAGWVARIVGSLRSVLLASMQNDPRRVKMVVSEKIS